MLQSDTGSPRRVRLVLTILRVAVALLLFIHGAARVGLGIVDDFGGAFEHWGFPAGHALAWGVTVGELVGGPALAAGLLVRPLAAWFVIQLIAGIVLVHAPAGWFVVGAGRNGVEFSVLLIVSLVMIAMTHHTAYRLGRKLSPDRVQSVLITKS